MHQPSCLLIRLSAMHQVHVLRSRRLSIGIYGDFGASNLCTKQLRNCIQNTFPDATISILSAKESLNSLLTNTIDLFCVGGGFARGVAKTMGTVGLKELKKFILSGGAYLGICSGAYLASALTRFDIGGPNEIFDEGFLNFFPGTAEGPLFAPYEYDSELGSSAALLTASVSDNIGLPSSVSVYFNGGCHFLGSSDSQTTVLYKYGELNTPAILLRNCGQGKVLLSGAHFEFDPTNLPELNGDPYTEKILPILLQHNANRVKLYKSLLRNIVSPVIH
uniref:BPL_N domain-containing protein n=1 Tax=Mesocestoides corti TaxID=53468 RepID=A0A5K3FN07_MESCO